MHGAGGAAKGFVTQLSSPRVRKCFSARCHCCRGRCFCCRYADPVGGELDGIIGYNVMQQFRVTIDYPMKRMRFES